MKNKDLKKNFGIKIYGILCSIKKQDNNVKTKRKVKRRFWK